MSSQPTSPNITTLTSAAIPEFNLAPPEIHPCRDCAVTALKVSTLIVLLIASIVGIMAIVVFGTMQLRFGFWRAVAITAPSMMAGIGVCCVIALKIDQLLQPKHMPEPQVMILRGPPPEPLNTTVDDIMGEAREYVDTHPCAVSKEALIEQMRKLQTFDALAQWLLSSGITWQHLVSCELLAPEHRQEFDDALRFRDCYFTVAEKTPRFVLQKTYAIVRVESYTIASKPIFSYKSICSSLFESEIEDYTETNLVADYKSSFTFFTGSQTRGNLVVIDGDPVIPRVAREPSQEKGATECLISRNVSPFTSKETTVTRLQNAKSFRDLQLLITEGLEWYHLVNHGIVGSETRARKITDSISELANYAGNLQFMTACSIFAKFTISKPTIASINDSMSSIIPNTETTEISTPLASHYKQALSSKLPDQEAIFKLFMSAMNLPQPLVDP